MSIRFVILCLLGLTGSANVASAECAWLLWRQTELPGSVPELWELRAAYTTITQCAEEITAQEKYSRAARLSSVQRRAPTHLLTGEAGTTTNWRCVPDTIDPRRPKTDR